MVVGVVVVVMLVRFAVLLLQVVLCVVIVEFVVRRVASSLVLVVVAVGLGDVVVVRVVQFVCVVGRVLAVFGDARVVIVVACVVFAV